jgi:hypothetical protein
MHMHSVLTRTKISKYVHVVGHVRHGNMMNLDGTAALTVFVFSSFIIYRRKRGNLKLLM